MEEFGFKDAIHFEDAEFMTLKIVWSMASEKRTFTLNTLSWWLGYSSERIVLNDNSLNGGMQPLCHL